MKTLYKWLAYMISSFVILAFCVPTLLSMPDTIAVLMGFGLGGAWFIITILIITSYIKVKKTESVKAI